MAEIQDMRRGMHLKGLAACALALFAMAAWPAGASGDDPPKDGKAAKESETKQSDDTSSKDAKQEEKSASKSDVSKDADKDAEKSTDKDGNQRAKATPTDPKAKKEPPRPSTQDLEAAKRRAKESLMRGAEKPSGAGAQMRNKIRAARQQTEKKQKAGDAPPPPKTNSIRSRVRPPLPPKDASNQPEQPTREAMRQHPAVPPDQAPRPESTASEQGAPDQPSAQQDQPSATQQAEPAPVQEAGGAEERAQPSEPMASEGAPTESDAGPDEAIGLTGKEEELPPTDTSFMFVTKTPTPTARTYSFRYENTPWSEVLADFSRVCGLSWLNEPDPPITESLTFHSPQEMTFEEALAQLNELLISRPLNKYVIQRQESYLKINRLPDLMRDVPEEKMFNDFSAFLAADLDPFDVVMVVYAIPEDRLAMGWDAFTIIDNFRRQFSDTYGTQAMGNDKIELVGLVREHLRFNNVIEKLTQRVPEPDDTRPLRQIQLKSAKVADVQNILKQLYPATAAQPRRQSGGPGMDPRAEQAERVDVIADVKNNILYLRAPADKAGEINDLIAQMDAGDPVRPPAMKIIKLRNADARALQGVLKPIFAQQQKQVQGRGQEFVPPEVADTMDVDIVADPTSNAVILVGSKRGIADAEKLVEDFDRRPDLTYELIDLKHADADEIAATLLQVLGAQAAAQGGGSSDLTITANASNQLFVACNKKDIGRVHELVERLDIPSPDELKERIVKLESAQPSAITPILQQVFPASSVTAAPTPAQQQQQARGKPRRPRNIARRTAANAVEGSQFIPDDASGHLIVFASDLEWPRIEQLIHRLDSQAKIVEPNLHTFRLQQADAADVAAMLNDMFMGGDAQGAPGDPVRRIYEDAFNNTIQVFADKTFVEKMRPLIEELDYQATAELTVIRLVYADAEEIAPILMENFSDAPVRRPTTRNRRNRRARAAAAKQGGATPPPAPTIAGDIKVKIMAEPVTNALLVTAPPKELEQIKELVAEMEESARQKKQQSQPIIVEAINRPADEIVSTISSIMGGGIVPSARARAAKVGQGESVVEDITFKIIASGKQIIMQGEPEDLARALQLVEYIDVPREKPGFRKYKVTDAEEDEKKLRAMLALTPVKRTEAPAAGDKTPAVRAAAQAQRLQAPDAIQIYPDTYENVLYVGAKYEEDFEIIEMLLRLIADEGTAVDPALEGSGELPFFVYSMKYKKVFDIAFTVEDIFNAHSKTPIRIDEGPDERTALVHCKPAQWETVQQYIEMFDVAGSMDLGSNMMIVDAKDTSPELMIDVLMRHWRPAGGRKVEVQTANYTEVETIDIHAGEAEAAEDVEDAPSEESPGAVTPCVLPASLAGPMASSALGQQVQANRPREIDDPSVCPVCHQSPCTLPAQMIRSLDAILLGSTDDQPEPEDVASPPQHNHPPIPVVNTTDGAQAAADSAAGQEPIRIIPDPVTGKLIIQGVNDEEREAIENVFYEFLEKPPTVLRVFPLKYADVNTAADLLNQIFNQAPSAAQRAALQRLQQLQKQQQQQQGKGGKGGKGQQGGEQQRGGGAAAQPSAQARIRVVPDPRIRSLFVYAPLSEIPLIIEVLKKIDSQIQPQEGTLKFFTLVNLDATLVAQSLQEVLGLNEVRQPVARNPRQARGRNAAQIQQQLQQQLQLQGEEESGALVSAEDVKITAEPQTNSVIVQAPETSMKLIEKLIDDLQSEKNQVEREVRRISLKHARATDVAPMVESVAQSLIRSPVAGAAQGGRGGRSGLGQSSVTVDADARTNSVVISGSSKDIEKLEAVIADLDQEQGGSQIRLFAIQGDPNETAQAIKELFVRSGAGSKADVIVSANASTGSVMVKAPEPQMKEITAQIEMMENEVDLHTTRHEIKLTIADAEKVAEALQELYGEGGSRNRNRKRAVTIKGLSSNQTVYVQGADEALLEEIKLTAISMDKTPSGLQVKSIELKYAAAADVYDKLQDMMIKAAQADGMGDVKLDLVGVVPDVRRNALIVTGGPVTFMLMDDVLDAVDVPVEDDLRQETTTYMLPQVVDVNQIARNINEMFRGDDPKKTGVERPTVTANAASNMVTVVATKGQHDRIKSSIIDPVLQQTGEPPQDHQIDLAHARADDIKPVIEDFMNKWRQARGNKPQDAFTITADPNSNKLLINCSPHVKEVFDKQLVELDSPSGRKETRFVKLNNARADEIANSLTQALQSKTVRNSKGQWPATVVPDVASNTLIVTAPGDMFDEIDQMVVNLDIETEGERIRRVFKLTYPDPGAVSRALQALFRPSVRNPSPQDEVRTADDWTTNSVIVTASKENMQEIERIIDEMDQPPGGGSREHHVIEVANSNPVDIANNLQQIFDAQVRGRRQQTSAVIRAIPGTTKVVAFANDEEFETIRGLVEKIDVQGGRLVHSVTMPELIPARSVAETITKLFGGQRQDGVKAEYHEPTNTLLVHATESEFEKIRTQVIDKVTEQPPYGVPQLYRIKLTYAVADEVAQTLQDFFDKKAGVRGGGRNLPPWMRSSQPAEALENAVSITAEPTSNMLLVYCTESVKEQIDEIIKEIDVDPSGEKVVEMVSLEHMAATEMIEILSEYLKVSKRTSEDDRQFVPWWMRRQGGDEDRTVLAGDTRLKAVESMNAIIVVGRPEAVADAVSKIKELDVEDTSGVNAPITIQLVHGNAAEIADVLSKAFEQDMKPDRGRQGAGTARPLSIVPVEASNQLLVSGMPAKVNNVKDLAIQLDGEMEGEGGDIRILQVQAGRDLYELADNIKSTMNAAEETRSRTQRGYQARRVEIQVDPNANALLVACSKAQFEQIRNMVEELVALGPVGGRVRRVIKLESMSPEQARQLIEQLQEGQGNDSRSRGRSGRGSNRRGGRRGSRSDADWTQQRRYEPSKAISRRAVAAVTLPAIAMQIALSTAVAQQPKQDEKPEPQKPIIHRIRPRTPTTQPALPMDLVEDGATTQPASQPAQRRGARREPTVAAQLEALADSEGALPRMSPQAQEAIAKRLSGAPINVAEAGPDALIFEGAEEDLEVIQSILELLDRTVPSKEIEYVQLKNARAEDLAQTIQQVFSKVEQIGNRPVQPEDKVDIIPDARTNGLYVAATEAKMERVLEAIYGGDKPSQFEQNVRTFTFRNRRVTEAGEVLKKLVASYLRQMKLPADAITVEIDPQTNSVFVTGGEADLTFVEKLVNGLDAEPEELAGEEGERPIGEADIMVVPLRVANAGELGLLLNEMLEKAATGDTPMKDFIRRMRLLDEFGEPIATINLNRPIAIFGEDDSNSLIIASTRENCLIMREVAKAFDREPARAAVSHVVIDLKYADASDVAEQLRNMLTESETLTQRPGKSETFGLPEGAAGALVYRAVVIADARTNQVVLVGRPDAVEIMSGLVGELDVPGMDVMPFEIVKLEFASATSLETALGELMNERAEAIPTGTGENAQKAETVIIKGDPRSNTLIIAARTGRMEEVKKLVSRLDVPATALVENIRAITLRKGNALDLADKLKDLWEQQKSQREGGTSGLQLETPAIVADERSNSLIVAASKSDFDAIKSVVEKIENLELNPMANIYILRLQHNSAPQLAPALRTLFERRAEMRTLNGEIRPEDRVSIEVDEVTNALLVAASRENYDVLTSKIAELDREVGVEGLVEFFDCTNVEAFRVKETIDAMFQDGVFKPGVSGDSQVAQARERVTVSTDPRANILIVSASPENMALVREIYKRMNSVTTPWDVAITRMLTLEHADAVQVAAQVRDHFEKLREVRPQGEGEQADPFGVTVFAEPRRNRLIIGGTKDGIERAVELVRGLDVPAGNPFQEIRVYSLTEAPVTRVGDILRTVFGQRNEPRQGGDGGAQVPDVPVTVEVNEASNNMVVNASREDHMLVAELVRELDRPSMMLQRVRVFPLERARSDKMKEILDEVYQAGQAGDGAASPVAVVEDNRVNAVVVAAPPGELENIGGLIARLDQAEATMAAEVGVFQCENEDAERMAELLNGIMTGQLEGGGGAAGEEEGIRELTSMLISFNTKADSGERVLLKTIRENVQITFNERTNSVVAVAPPSSLRLIEALITKLDRIEKRPVMVRAFQLVHSDASRMVELLNEMFAADGGGDDQAAFQQGREFNVEGGMSEIGAVPSPAGGLGETRRGTFGRPRTTFVADERTNSLIAAGWQSDIEVVADIIDQLDSKAINQRDNFVYTLINATAEDVQSAMETFFQQEAERLGSIENVSQQQRLDQEVSIVAHEETNQVIMSVSPRYRSRVVQLIEQLDMPPPQVMIQVMVAEVSLDDRFEMGLEFALQQLRFSETAVPDANGILQSASFDVIGGTDLGAAGGGGVAGFSFTITGEDFNFLVRALQSDSRLEVIQRPMIMCQDNQTANITIGQSVPFIRGTQVTENGQVTSQVEYEDIGIILDVEPHINPDGFVYLFVRPELSAITDSTIDIGNGVLAPIFTNRVAETTVAVKDGETVVIGGLITTSENESESKVPFLGDIPGLGVLFRSTSRTKMKTELLIALTPRIVRTVEDARRLSVELRDESGIITEQMKQSPMFGKLRITPESESEVSDIEFEPTIDSGGLDEDLVPREPAPVEEKPKYGPQAPKYGPQARKYGPRAPGDDDDVVVRRDRRWQVNTARRSRQ